MEAISTLRRAREQTGERKNGIQVLGSCVKTALFRRAFRAQGRFDDCAMPFYGIAEITQGWGGTRDSLGASPTMDAATMEGTWDIKQQQFLYSNLRGKVECKHH